jgi:hypothetical protein
MDEMRRLKLEDETMCLPILCGLRRKNPWGSLRNLAMLAGSKLGAKQHKMTPHHAKACRASTPKSHPDLHCCQPPIATRTDISSVKTLTVKASS